MASSRGITPYPRTDGERLNVLADWLDRLDATLIYSRAQHDGCDRGDEVQRDLRRIANRLDEIDHVADRLSIIMSMSAYKHLSDPPEFDFDVVLDQLELHLELLGETRRNPLKDCDCVL